MPYPNEHAARVRQPGAFQANSFRRKKITDGIDIIVGRLRGESTMTTQAYRFDRTKYTAAEARKWLADHDVKPISFEPASTKEVKLSDLETATPKEVETEEKMDSGATVLSLIPGNALTFDDIEEYQTAEECRGRVNEVMRQFETLTSNVMWSPDVPDKVGAMKTLVGQLGVRLDDAMEMKEKGFIDRLKEKFVKPKRQPEQRAPTNGLFVWKEGDRYRWFAVYSNKYRDSDTPPEIICEKAHIEFVETVDKGLAPYPELWHWHVPGSRWGRSDWLAYDPSTGFSMASGFVDQAHESEAKAIAELPEPLGVSHGLEVKGRDESDNTIITQYESYEISDLPIEAAANKLTGFTMLKEDKGMSIPDEKKAYLKRVGLSEEKISEIESDLQSKATTAKTEGLEFKNTASVETPPQAGESKAPDAEAEKKDDQPQPITREEIAEAIASAQRPVLEQMATLTNAVSKIATAEADKQKQVIADTPMLSIAHLVTRSLGITKSDATKVTSDEENDKPPEARHDKETISGVPWLDDMLVASKPQ